MARRSSGLRRELMLALAAKALVLAAIGMLLFGPADRPVVTAALLARNFLGCGP